ncbi:hypothetical protein H5410_007242 [Solanum commersonii]|uniref:Uncharacterized protein n=1 Tax=Solanum commersonii TaxID=4109 RepID=A0A9J6ABY0_SOLCO|nr:hypothetical protein H5410_007242 [Solanum commersonii]
MKITDKIREIRAVSTRHLSYAGNTLSLRGTVLPPAPRMYTADLIWSRITMHKHRRFMGQAMELGGLYRTRTDWQRKTIVGHKATNHSLALHQQSATYKGKALSSNACEFLFYASIPFYSLLFFSS